MLGDVSASVSIKEADPEVLPQGPVTRSKARKFRDVISLNCVKLSDSLNDIPALDNLNDADTPSSSSTQLIKAPISSTSALLAQLKLNNLEVAESVLRQLEAVLHLGGGVLSMCMACGTFTHERAYISPRFVTYEEGSSDDPEEHPPSLHTQAIIRELKKSFREELEPIHDRLERLQGSQTNATEEDHAENGSDQTPNQRQNPRQGRVQQVDDNLTNIKVAIPSFQGRTDPDAKVPTSVLDP
ncbi:hypothetical protein GQ457_11G026000 [Hibiscus cannabinus]